MRILIKNKLSEHKYKTPEGYLVCVDSPIARTGPQEYRVCDIDENSDDESPIEINRNSEDVFSPETIASFENKPLTNEHPTENVTPTNFRNYSVGFARDIHQGKFEGQDVILGTLIFTDEEAISDIESGRKTELSCGYDCDIVERDGKYYQTNIRGNHIALCEAGRAGIAKILDSATEDVEYKNLSEAAKKLKEELGLYKRQIGSHLTKTYNDPKPRKNQYNNSNVAELNESINEAIENLSKGMYNSNAWYRLSQHLESWSGNPELNNICKRANNAIKKFINYIDTRISDELIQSSSEEALQKNIKTEIESGKDPKQAVAIAYATKRKNDVDTREESTKKLEEELPIYEEDEMTELIKDENKPYKTNIDYVNSYGKTISTDTLSFKTFKEADKYVKNMLYKIYANEGFVDFAFIIYEDENKKPQPLRLYKDNGDKKTWKLDPRYNINNELTKDNEVMEEEEVKVKDEAIYAYWADPITEKDVIERAKKLPLTLIKNSNFGVELITIKGKAEDLAKALDVTTDEILASLGKGKFFIRKVRDNEVKDGSLAHSKLRVGQSVKFKKDGKMMNGKVEAFWYKGNPVKEDHFEQSNINHDLDHIVVLGEDGVKYRVNRYQLSDSKTLTATKAIDAIKKIKKYTSNKTNDSRINDSKASEVVSEIKRTYPQVKMRIISKKVKNKSVTDIYFTNYPGEGASGFGNDPRTKLRDNWEKFLKHVYAKYVSKDFVTYYVSYRYIAIVEEIE